MRQIVAILLACTLAACGWVEVEPDGPPPPLPPQRQVAPPPAPATAIDPGVGLRQITVRRGDTVFGLSELYSATPRQMIALNNLRPPFDIQVGQRLFLPPNQRLHRVRQGETLGSISDSYRAPLEDIAAVNFLRPPYPLRIGEKIGIPISRPRQDVFASARRQPQARAPAPEAPAAKPPAQSIETQALPPSPPARRPEAAVQPPKPPAPKPLAPEPPPAPPAPEIKEAVAAPAPSELSPPPRPRVRPPELASAQPEPAPQQQETTSPPVAKPAPQPAPRPKPKPQSASVATPGKSGGFLAPVEGPIIAGFGNQADGRRNDGVNIAAPKGSPVRASDGGEVVYAGDALQGYGNLVLVKHKNGWVTAYAHLDSILAKRGEKVRRGQTIGTVGSSGGVARPQLHFEMRRNNKAVDPRGRLAAT